MSRLAQRSLLVAFVTLSGCSLWHRFQQAAKLDCSQRHQWFADRVEPILQSRCVTCHVAGGFAQSSGFVLGDNVDANFAAVNSVAQQKQGGTSIVLLKPTGLISHTGGKLTPPGSAEYDALDTMVQMYEQCADATDALVATMMDAPSGPFTPTYLPATVRRLTRAEYDNTVADLLGTATTPSDGFALDARQSGFTVNLDQRVDATLGDQLAAAAQALADEAVASRLGTLVPCDVTSAGCDRTFVAGFATKAFRRPLASDELTALLGVFHTAADGATFGDGVNAVIAAVLQSASFLYVAQIGAPGADGLNQLDPYETASVLSYFATAHPPDATLLQAAANDALKTPDQIEAQLRRLFGASQDQLVRFVREWLGIDSPTAAPRTSAVDFASLWPSMRAETDAFVRYAATKDGATLATLLGADFTAADASLAAFYGISAGAPASLAGTQRRGLLAQGAFLATYAHDTYSSPVKRGVTVLRKLLCRDLQVPAGAIAMKAMAPLPTPPNTTTRDRFAQHATDALCSGCHTVLDGLGFAFEEFDQVGQLRATDNGQPVDATGTLVGTDVDGGYTNAADMMSKLSTSPEVAGCVANFVVRFAAGTTLAPLESTFAQSWTALPPDKRASVIETMVAFSRSDLFVKRSVPQ